MYYLASQLAIKQRVILIQRRIPLNKWRISLNQWDGFNRISIEEVNEIKQYLDKYVWFLKPEKDFTLTSILNQIKAIKQRYGLEYFVIDAWNKIEHADDKTSYIGKCLDEIVTFCEINNVHCFLVAHPTKIKKNINTGKYEVPTLYDIAGSANSSSVLMSPFFSIIFLSDP